MSCLINVKRVTPVDASPLAVHVITDIGCAAESALLAFALSLAPAFRDALMKGYRHG